MINSRKGPSRRFLFTAFCSVCVGGALAYVMLRQRTVAPSAAIDLPAAENIGVLGGRNGLLFSSTAFDATNGTIVMAPVNSPDVERRRTFLRCERVHFGGGVGLCLSAKRGVITTFAALVFGPDFRVRYTMPLKGVPSRARVSADGRRGAFTVFVSGDSYNSTSFSTRTTLVNMLTGERIADLEEFAVTRGGAPFKAVDFNFWGVTFARDGNQFFATLRTGGSIYLIEGDVDGRRARILREGVECPSLSPDDRRIVFKKRISPSKWQLQVLDVGTLADSPLAESRSVDDQVEWLNDETIAYMLPSSESSGGGSDIWSLRIDGAPRLLAKGGTSPVALSPSTGAPRRLSQ